MRRIWHLFARDPAQELTLLMTWPCMLRHFLIASTLSYLIACSLPCTLREIGVMYGCYCNLCCVMLLFQISSWDFSLIIGSWMRTFAHGFVGSMYCTVTLQYIAQGKFCLRVWRIRMLRTWKITKKQRSKTVDLFQVHFLLLSAQ